MEVESYHEDIDNAISGLTHKIVGLETQKEGLDTLFKRWDESGKGESCIVTGPLGSGRTTVVSDIMNTYIKKAVCDLIYVSQLGSDATIHDVVKNKNDTSPRIIIIEDADELASRVRQTLLFTILDATRTLPWLVILMTNRQDFVTVLEKRVRSRLSSIKFTFRGCYSAIEFSNALIEFLSSSNSSRWNSFVSAKLKEVPYVKDIGYFYQLSPSFGRLKHFAAILLSILLDVENIEGEFKEVWDAALQSVVPHKNPVNNILNDLSLRSRCVLLCIYRRLREQPNGSMTYKKVLIDYKNLCQNADRRMIPSSDEVIYKEIDRLVFLGLCDADKKNINISYRRVTLHADLEAFTNGFKDLSLPSAIREWGRGLVEH